MAKRKKQTEIENMDVGRSVYCPNCGLVQYETTEQYRADIAAHPGMIKMLEPYLSWGWTQPPQDDSAGYGVLECGECGAPLAPNGKLKVIRI